MRKLTQRLLVATLVIGGSVGLAAAAGGQPTAPVTEQVSSTVRQQQPAPAYGSQVRLSTQDQKRLQDGTCDPVDDQLPVRDRDRDRDQDRAHDPIQDRDRLHERLAGR